MVAVADNFRLHIGVFHSGGDDAGVPVVDTGHGVVQVGQVGHAGIHSGLGVVVVGIGVGDGHGAQLAGLLHEFRRAGQLGSDVHNAHQAVATLKQGLEALEIRLLQVVGILGTPLLVGKVGAFHLDAHEPGVARGGFCLQLLCGSEGLFQHVVGERHGGGGKGGHAAGSIVGRHFFQAIIVAVGEVRAGVAVAVDIHQTGDDGSTLQINGIGGNRLGQHRAEPTVPDLKGTVGKLKIGSEDSRVFIKHRKNSFTVFLQKYNIMKSLKKQSGLWEKFPGEKIKLVMGRKRLLFPLRADIMESIENGEEKEVAK